MYSAFGKISTITFNHLKVSRNSQSTESSNNYPFTGIDKLSIPAYQFVSTNFTPRPVFDLFIHQ